MKKFWVSAYSPLRDNMLFIRSCGHCCIDSKWREKVRTINFANFYWCVEGCGYFKKDKKYHELRSGEVWYIPPGGKHDFFAGKEGFHYYWIAFEGEALPMIEKMLKLSPGAKYCGKPPEELFSRILSDLQHLTPELRLEILGVGLQVLFHIASFTPPRPKENKNIANAAREFIESSFADPEFTVNSMASELRVHRVTLSREFKKAFNISPSDYLKGCRLRKAVEMLSTKNHSIKEIAFACGFSSPEYFATVFASEFGYPPSTY